MTRAVVWILVAAALVAGAWFLFRTPSVPVDDAVIGRGPIRAVVEEEGKTRVRERYVVSAPVEGRLYRARHEEGDRVEKDELVGEIDPLPLESRVEEAEATVRALERRVEGVATRKPKADEIERARLEETRAKEAQAIDEKLLAEVQAEAGHAQNELDRAEALARERTLSLSELEATRTVADRARQRLLAQEVRVRVRNLEIAMAELDRRVLEARVHDYDWQEQDYREQIAALQAALAATRADLQRTRLLSPVAGVVLNVLRESEQFVTAGTPVLEIGDLSDLEVEVEFLSEDAAHMSVGMPAEVFGSALGERVLKGKVARIHPSAFTKISSLGVEQQRVKVLLAFEDPPAGLADLHRVEARVILDSRADAVLVPEGALFRSDRNWNVFRVEEGRARSVTVETGLRDGRMREVLSGLAPGDRVVLHPPDDLAEGARVE